MKHCFPEVVKSILERHDTPDFPAGRAILPGDATPGALAATGPDPSKPAGVLRKAARRVPPELPIFLLYVLLAVYLTWPVAKGLNHYIYGWPSDNMGAMWTWWWYRKAGSFGATASFCPIISFPFGQHLTPWSGEIVLDLSVRFMLLFVPQTAVYNLIVTSSFMLSGVTMYYLARHVTADRRVAFFGGLAYLVGAFHAVHAMMFANLAITQWMPLYILALLVFIRKASTRNAALLLLTALLVAGTSIHYALFMAAFTAAFLIGRFAYLRISLSRMLRSGETPGREPLTVNRKTLLLSLLVILVVVAVVPPLFLSGYNRSSKAGNWPTRTIPGNRRTVETDRDGSASPLAYVLPEKENFLLGPITRRLAPGRLNRYQNSLYLGLTVTALAVLAIATLFFPREKKKRAPALPPGVGRAEADGGLGDATGAGRPAGGAGAACCEPSPGAARTPPGGTRGDPDSRGLAWGFVAAAAAGFVLSMPPYFCVGSTRIPLPSMLVHFTVPWIRWYLRFGVIVIICFILLACLGLRYLLRKSGRAVALLVLLVASAFLFLEMTLVPPARYFTAPDRPPGVFDRIAGMDVGAVVVYPAFESGFFNAQRYMLYQQYHRKPMLNGGMENSDGEALRRTVYNPFSPQTPAVLSRYGITHVVYLDSVFEDYEGTLKAKDEVKHLPSGLEPVAKVSDSDYFGRGRVYRVTAPKAEVVPIYQGDITVPHLDTGRETVRLMENTGMIRLVNYSGRDLAADVRIPVSNVALQHDITVSDGSSVLWKETVTGERATVIDLPGLKIPGGGLVLNLSVTGPRLPLVKYEAETFGTPYATIRIGDVLIEPSSAPRSGGAAG